MHGGRDSSEQAAGPGGAAFVQEYLRVPKGAGEGLPEQSAAEPIEDRQFRLLAENIPTLCWMANGDGYIFWYNRRWYDYTGTTPAQMEGWGWRSVHHPDELPSVMERWTASVATGQPFEMTFPLLGADGVYRPFLTRIQPVRDDAGRVTRWFGVNTDVSEQQAAEAALQESEALASRILKGMAEGFALLDPDFRVLAINDEGLRMEQRPREELLGRTHWEAWPGSEHSELGRLYKQAMAERVPVTLEHRYAWEDGHDVWIEMRAYPSPDGLAIFYRDVTHRKRAEISLLQSQRDLRLMVDELNHRVKNNLATVQAIALQTLRGTESLPEARNAFLSRLMALASAHDVLTREQWEGAPLTEIARGVLEPLCGGDGERMTIEGPPVLLTPRAALSIAMALHELCTNALKYGALSSSGRIELQWGVEADEDEGRLFLRWVEQGGPPVQVPTRSGFGTRLLERGLSAELRGRVELDFRREGLVCTIEVPAARVDEDWLVG